MTPLEMLKTAAGKGSVIHPVVVVNANGIKCRALLDSGAGSSYASAALLDRLKKHPIRREPRRIEMMMHTVNKMTEVRDLEISNLKGDFHIKTEVTKVDRASLLSLENPKYDRVLEQYSHLIPIHLILGASEYARIKVEAKPRCSVYEEFKEQLVRSPEGWYETGLPWRANHPYKTP